MGSVGTNGSSGSSALTNSLASEFLRYYGINPAENSAQLAEESKTDDIRRLLEISKEVGTSGITVGFVPTGADDVLRSVEIVNGRIYSGGKDITSDATIAGIDNDVAKNAIRTSIRRTVEAEAAWKERAKNIIKDRDTIIGNRFKGEKPKIVGVRKPLGPTSWGLVVEHDRTRRDGSTYRATDIVYIPDSYMR